MKRCLDCKLDLPLTAFGRESYCRPCKVARVRAWEAANPERNAENRARAQAKYNAKHRKPPRPKVQKPIRVCEVCGAGRSEMPRGSQRCYGCLTEKPCSHCGETKPLEAFTSHVGKRDGRTSWCNACLAARSRALRASHPDVKRREKRAYIERLAARAEIVLPDEKKCRSCHVVKAASEFSPDRRRADGLYDKCKECRARWYYQVDRFVIYEREGGRCHICRKPVARDAFHIEHLFPRAAGGTDDPSNLAVAHPACNYSKNDKVVDVQLRLAS